VSGGQGGREIYYYIYVLEIGFDEFLID